MTEVPGQGMPLTRIPRSEPYFAGAEDHSKYLWLANSIVRVLFDSAATGGQFTLVENRTREPFASPLHVHDIEDEAFVVLDGRIRVWVGQDRRDIDAGGVGFLPHGVPHAFRVMTETARFMVLAIPAGLEQLYQGAGHDLRSPAPDGWAVSIDRIATSEAVRGNRVLGPPPGVDDPPAVHPPE